MKICIVTGTRAEYGLLKPLIQKIGSQNDLVLQLLVTGSHLSPEFGLTYQQIESDGFVISEKVEMLLSSDSSAGIVKSMGLGMIGYADSLNRLKPDLIIILGDRYEMLSLASSALIFRIPIVHLCGGEITEGAYDDSIRHSLTKMSHLHFATTEEHRHRIIQMGEQPATVFNVGAIGLDSIKETALLTREELSKNLKVEFKKFTYLVTFHPETLAASSVEDQFNSLLKAIEHQKDSFFVFTKANADSGGRIINEMIDSFVNTHAETSISFTSMGQLRYLSAMKYVTAVVGNSSSGIVEAPSFQIPTINIGDRQKGRVQAASVINVACDQFEIAAAFDKIKDQEFMKKLTTVVNPYGNGDTANQIMKVLKEINIGSFRSKSFYNIRNESSY